MEFESSMKVHFTYRIPAGETAPVDSLLAIIGKEGEDISLLSGKPAEATPAADTKPTSEAVAVPETTKESSSVATSLPKSGNNDASFKRHDDRRNRCNLVEK
jgi:pyruvate dehydrogenase E2 component (dihydrolipoamide acetyltransferase)